jgi:rubrerythrin
MNGTMKQQRILWELQQSMGEERAAGSVYLDRALTADELEYHWIADVYREIAADELQDHYVKFEKAAAKLLGIEYKPELEMVSVMSGVVINEDRAKSGPCKCAGGRFCWHPGYIGLLSKEQREQVCTNNQVEIGG